MAASAIRLNFDVDQAVTTSDANLTIVYAPPFCAGVLVQARTQDAYVQVKGAVQGEAVGVALSLGADKAVTVTPSMCGVSGVDGWSFGVARQAAGAVIVCCAMVA